MTQELAFVVVTPHTIRKSRTGAVVGRLLSLASSELVAARLFATSREVAERYAATIRPSADPVDEAHRKLIREYILQNFSPDPDGRRHRSLVLVFRGKSAYEDIKRIVGNVLANSDSGETIRDTYGELIRDPDGSVRYFEPAVLIPDSAATVTADLQVWMDYSEEEPALLAQVPRYRHPEQVQQTLVMIKPDSWRTRSSRPGAVIDMFSRTGLRMIGMKLNRMSVAQALEFYGPVAATLEKKLAPVAARRALAAIEGELGFSLPKGSLEKLVKLAGLPYARHQFEQIVTFMTGRCPSDCTPGEQDRAGLVKSLVIVYEGEDAVAKIRAVLGPTDPSKAPGGTVRSEFGSSIMVNTAHASDSPENAAREIEILHMRESIFADVVRRAIAEIGN
ncbi:MAG: nucleoside-diphosphate kinase [Lentisphaeria bacterium]|jgi:nucleoside diphosphate kinase|nr:nucleoside-diphosphate kinase [Lentisphaeria bacterium]